MCIFNVSFFYNIIFIETSHCPSNVYKYGTDYPIVWRACLCVCVRALLDFVPCTHTTMRDNQPPVSIYYSLMIPSHTRPAADCVCACRSLKDTSFKDRFNVDESEGQRRPVEQLRTRNTYTRRELVVLL